MKDSQSHASNNFKMNIINRAKLKNGNLNRAVEYAFYEVNSAVTYLTYNIQRINQQSNISSKFCQI